ncbi:hypothetical protein BZM27_53905, partial [Paraburkholderia steynii]
GAFAAKVTIPLERVDSWLKGAPISVEDAVAIQTVFGYTAPGCLARVGQKKAAIQHNDEYRPKGLGKRKALAVVGMAQLGDNGYWADIEYPVGHGDGYIDWADDGPRRIRNRMFGRLDAAPNQAWRIRDHRAEPSDSAREKRSWSSRKTVA